MIPDKSSVLTYASTQRLTHRDAALRLLATAGVDELRHYVGEKLAEQATREARKQVTETDLPDMTPKQLALFELHTDLPAIVRTEVAGEELFIHWQSATLDEHADSLRFKRGYHIQQAGIAERLEQRIYQMDEDRDIAVGYLTFGSIHCCVCGDAWEQNDPRGPFELAHTQPVAGRSGDTDMHWAHRECNRSQGTA